MMEEIILLVVWLVATEVAYFGRCRGRADTFFEGKIVSIFIGMAFTFISFGIPWMIATDEGVGIGNVFYFWYYGSIAAIVIFFGINYLIHKKLEKKESKR